MGKELTCKIGYFSLDENNPLILTHIAKDGLAAALENNYIRDKKSFRKKCGLFPYALENASHNSFICVFSEEIAEAIKLVENFRVTQDRPILVEQSE